MSHWTECKKSEAPESEDNGQLMDNVDGVDWRFLDADVSWTLQHSKVLGSARDGAGLGAAHRSLNPHRRMFTTTSTRLVAGALER